MKTFLLGLLMLTASIHAAIPSGKSQSLTSPDQVPEGLAKSDWHSIRAAYEAGRHAFHAVDGGWQARNPGQQWTTKFDGRGFLATPRDGGWSWGLELKSYGFGDRQQSIKGKPEVTANGQRLSYQWDVNLQEWFVNDQRGLEHGFIVKNRPQADSAATSATLDFLITTRGSLRPAITPDAKGVSFRDLQGNAALNYAGLKVWDADGKTLNARFESAGENQVRLRVEEQGARYPITIDPIAQQAYLKAGNNGGPTGDVFGTSVAASGDTVVIGASGEDSGSVGVNSIPDDSATESGAVYVFVRSGSIWSQQAYLKASNTGAGDAFGAEVSISGDTIVVGAPLEGSSTTGVNGVPNENAQSAGAAYVFLRSGGSWSQQAYLKASNSGAGDRFGSSVSISGDTITVGAPLEDSGKPGINGIPDETAPDSGAAYVFVRGVSGWSQQAYLKPLNPGGSDQFGTSVCVSGESLIVGAYWEDGSSKTINGAPDEGAANSGAAYVFARAGTTWTQQAYLKASNSGSNDWFGYSVSLSGDTAVVGAYREKSTSTGINSVPNDNHWYDPGAAYVFVRNGTIWSQQAYIKPSNNSDYGEFGKSVFISGNSVIIGAPGEDSSTTGINTIPNTLAQDSGAAYLFSRTGSTWAQQAYIKAANSGAGDLFGKAVCIAGDLMLIGAPGEDSNTVGINGESNEKASGSGASYAFVRSGTAVTQEAFLKSSNTPTGEIGVGDRFGGSVAVSGDTVVIGSPNEDSNTTGVNSVPNESATDSGSVYVFIRSGSSWLQQAYLKASNTGAFDRFGCSVAISGDTLVIGALNEDSSTVGVNTTPNESASNSGAAYVFVRNGTAWTQQAFLKASNTGANDFFGTKVSISGDTLVVGASHEDSTTTGINSTPNDSGLDHGAVYVFVRSGSAWTQQAYLKASNTIPVSDTGAQGDRFGEAVSISGNTIVVGAYQEDSSTVGVASTPNDFAPDSGAAYIFVRSGTSWIQQAYLKASNTHGVAHFGNSVAISGETVVVGARQEESSTTGVNSAPNRSALRAGAAYVFVRSGTTWTQQAYLKASNTRANDTFGDDVAISGNTIVVGAPYEDFNLTGVNSSLSGATVSSNSGAAYVFLRSGTSWTQQAYLKASNTGASDLFGISVGVSADLVIVGASGEDSSTTEVNSPYNENATDAGAVYVFGGFGPLNVTSPSSNGITTTSATLGGNVVSDGGASITERGVVYSPTATNANPLIGGTGVTKVTTTGTTGVFTINISGLSPGTGYSFKAYATNSSGTVYTSAATFTTLHNNANLSNLVLSNGTLSPVFASGTTTYAASVPNTTTSVTVTPTVAHSTATVRVNNVSVTSGTASGAISLNVGSNVISTVVTAQDGTSRTYTVTVTRIGPPTVTTPTSGSITGTAATLGGNVTSDNGAAITERGIVYSATATNSNPLIGGTGVVKVTGTGTTGVFTVNATGLTAATGYSYKAYATNSAGTSYTTAAGFTTLSSNANLSNLVLSSGAITPVFASATLSYAASVPNSTTSLTVTPTASSTLATIRVNGVTVSSGAASGAISLNVGSNTITTVVTAQDGTIRTYTVTVTRAAAPPTVTTPTSASITASAATLGGNVTADGGSAVTERGIVYSVTSTNSNPLIGGTGVTKVAGTGTTGVFTVTTSGLANATAYTFKAYATNGAGTGYTAVGTFTTLNSNNTLSNLILSSGTLSPAFASTTTSYTASVSNGTASLTVTPTTASSSSTVKVNNVTVASGTASGPISLNVGSNPITVIVTAQDGTTRTYTVTVTRPGPPTVTSPTSATIGTTSATLGGDVASDNGAAIVERGVVYSRSSTNSDPAIGGTGVTKVTGAGTTGVFTVGVSGLTAATNYAFKAYAINGVGITYSSVATFLTLTPPPPVFTQATTATTVAGALFQFQLQASNGPNTFSCSNLPPWLSLNTASGWLSGTPPAAGTFNLSLTANNGFHQTTGSLSITVTPPPPTITSSLSDEGRQNEDYRYTITAAGGATSFSVGVLPSGLSFNTSTGVISGRPTVSGTFNIVLGATNSGGMVNATLVLRLLPAIPPPVITSPSFASGNANVPFSFQLAASNTPQSYAIQNGPAWLGVNPATGQLSGTPTVPGTVTVQVRASNNTGPGNWSVLSIAIAPHPNAPVITSLAEARGRKGDAFAFQLTASPAATSYAITGALPGGVGLNASTGLLSGTPTVEGTFNLSVTASNASGQSVATPLRIVLGPSRQVPVITSATNFVATTGVAFSATVQASNSPTSFTFTGLPPGVAQVGTSGQISGTPTTPGSFAFTVRGNNADGSGPVQNGVVNVQYNANAPKITVLTIPLGYVGVPFSYQILTDKAATSFTVIGGTSLPPGLTLGASSGLIGGTPTTSGSFSVTLQASNASGPGEPRGFVITIAPKPDTPEIIGSLLEETRALASYAYTVQTKSALPILSYSITGLPDGLTANSTTGRISGAATVTGVFEVRLKASSSAGVGAEKIMRLTVRAGSLVPKITSSASASAMQGAAFSYQITATNSPILGWEAAPLPDGLSLNPATGLISGKPVVAGTYQVALRATNVNGASDPLTLQLQVKPAMAVPVMVIPAYYYYYSGQPFELELQATGLPATKPWPAGIGIFAENLPSGMSINSSTGVLSGFPVQDSGWASRSISFYAVNEAGRGVSAAMTLRTRSLPASRPIMLSPKQLSATYGSPLSFGIVADRFVSFYEFVFFVPGQPYLSYGQYTPAFQITPPIPGRYSYHIAAWNGEWGVLSGLPLSVAPAPGAPVITTPNIINSVAGSPVSASLTASGSPNRFEISAVSPAWPSGLSLNATTGAISGTVTRSGPVSFLARAYNAVGASLPKEVTLYFAPPPGAPAVTQGGAVGVRSTEGYPVASMMAAPPLALNAKVGEVFSHQFQATGDVIRFTVAGLPEGLVYNENTGEVSGEPMIPGDFDLVVTPIGESVSGQPVTVSLRVAAADGTPSITSPSVASAVAGTSFSWQFTASEAPAGYELGELPDWLNFDPITGTLAGTPEAPGEIQLTVSGFNASGRGNAQTFAIQIAAAPGTPTMIPPASVLNGQVGVEFSGTISASGGATFYDSTALPFGISLDAETGTFSGIPVEPGSHEVRVWGVNDQGIGASIDVTFVIAPADGTPRFEGEPVLRLLAGQSSQHAFATQPVANAYAAEGLPTGWIFDTSSGTLQATPLAGIYRLTLEAWNEAGSSGKHNVEVRVLANSGDLWKDRYFGEEAHDPSVSGWNEDPDGDGVVNLLERAFNLSPIETGLNRLTADTGTSGLPLVRSLKIEGRSVLSIQYLRRKAGTNPGITYTPEVSSSLGGTGSWSPVIGTETVESIDEDWERVTIVEEPGDRPKRFGRIKVAESIPQNEGTVQAMSRGLQEVVKPPANQ